MVGIMKPSAAVAALSAALAVGGAAAVAREYSAAGRYVVTVPGAWDAPPVRGVTPYPRTPELAALGARVVYVRGASALAALEAAGADAEARDRVGLGSAVKTRQWGALAPLAPTPAPRPDPLRQWHIDRARVLEAERRGYTGLGVRVAVVDSGIAAHPDLAIAAGADFTGAGTWADDNGHGTHVAGIIGARSGNGRGGRGVAPGASLLAVRVLDSAGKGYDDWIASGIVWAANNGAGVINLSIGSAEPSELLRRALAYATGRGALVVCAAGNAGTVAPDYPSAYPDCLSVAASDSLDRLAHWSNRGPTVDITAPGVDIWSTCIDGGGYCGMSGTSMAAPVVAGAAALVFSSGVRSPAGISWRLRSRAMVRDQLPARRLIDAGAATR